MRSATGSPVLVFSLEADDARLAECARLLAPDEARRAAAYDAQRRRRFTVARSTLRTLLGEVVGIEASRVRFVYGRGGKPALDPGLDVPNVEFSVAHARDLCAIAMSQRGRVGVDVEFEGRSLQLETLIQRYFSQAERDALSALSPEQRRHAFFRAWTRKEAFLKARGEGISQRLTTTEVTLGPTEPPNIRRIDGEPGEHLRWRLTDLALPPGYVGAIAEEDA